MTGPDDDHVKAAAAIGAAHYRPGALARVDAYFDQVKAQRQAARAMLAALKTNEKYFLAEEYGTEHELAVTRAAIARADAAGIKAEGE